MARWVGFLVVLLCGCQETRHVVERADVIGATVSDNAVLGLSPGQIQSLLNQRLEGNPRFKVLKPGQKSPDDGTVIRMTLELAFTREEQKPEPPGTFAQVGASLGIRRRTNDGVSRYDVAGVGETRVTGASLDERQDAVRRALALALDQVVASARFQLDALDKGDKALLKDMDSPDARVKEFALRVLAERKNPAAVPSLLEKLNDADLDEERRAMGALVEMRETRAVPALIDLSRGKELGFLREIVFALGAIGGDEAQAYLYTVAQGHDQAAIRDAAQQALDELEQHASRGAVPGSRMKGASAKAAGSP